MAVIEENVSLLPFNTLRLDVRARFFTVVESTTDLQHLVAQGWFKDHDFFVLGGGSNVVFAGDFAGLIVRIGLSGIRVQASGDDFVDVIAGAGEDWPALVEFCVKQGFGGIENLAMVPGTVGAAPVNNIACYGHNLHETLQWVEAVDLLSGEVVRLSVQECELGYRTSVFKTRLSKSHAITRVCLRLSRNPVLNTRYRSRYESVEDELGRIAVPPFSVRDVFQAIINIRTRKLPGVKDVGTVGSVFTNPIISNEDFARISALCPGIHCYPAEHLIYGAHGNGENAEKAVKIPAAWLIEDMGWAGRRWGPVGLWQTQPLNIVNFGGATPEQYTAVMDLVVTEVWRRYGVTLTPEVAII